MYAAVNWFASAELGSNAKYLPNPGVVKLADSGFPAYSVTWTLASDTSELASTVRLTFTVEPLTSLLVLAVKLAVRFSATRVSVVVVDEVVEVVVVVVVVVVVLVVDDVEVVAGTVVVDDVTTVKSAHSFHLDVTESTVSGG